MKDVCTVAKYILDKTSYISAMKLQKLVFYSQAYYLVKFHCVLFKNRIEAWANGPVTPDLYRYHRHKFILSSSDLNNCLKNEQLSQQETSCIDYVVDILNEYSGEELSNMTHNEKPWKDARIGCEAAEPSHNEITSVAILNYYSSKECNNVIFR